MTLSDLSIRRPVLATVMSLVIIAFGLVAFARLPLRELPDVDRPVISIDVTYRGAPAPVVEAQVTRVIEDQLSGIEGIDIINATSRDGRASINVECNLGRDLEAAANDVRNAVARARDQLPRDVEEPSVQKADTDAEPIIWLSLASSTLTQIELADYADRYLVDEFGVIDGVASVRTSGIRPALRIWLDTNALAARGLTVEDVETALTTQNVELPAGYVQGVERDYQLRVVRAFETPEQFARLPLRTPQAAGAAVVRLGDVARIEFAPEETRRLFRGNGKDQIGMGIVRQSQSNALSVGRRVKERAEALARNLPPGAELVIAYDSTVFIEKAIERVAESLLESTLLVIAVIYLFLGSWRAAFIPAAVIPVCLIGSFAILYAFGFSINLLTLMGLVLAIGLVVDDSIVMLENAQRRIDTLGEPRLVASTRGARQIYFAIVATTAVLVAVFTPMLFVGGYVGRLFIELAVTVAGVIVISAFAALSLSPMMCSRYLRPAKQETRLHAFVEKQLERIRRSYRASLEAAMGAKPLVFAVAGLVMAGGAFLFFSLSSELTPVEDRGNLVISVQAPEGSGFEYTSRVMGQVEDLLMSYVETGEVQRVLLVAPGFGDSGTQRFSSGFGRIFLAPWEERKRSGMAIERELNARLSQIPGAVIRMRLLSAFQTRGGGDGASITLRAATYEEIAPVAEATIAAMRNDQRFQRPRADYEPNSPRVLVHIDAERAAALGVSVQAVGRTLESTMGARRINTITDRGEEYYVFLQAERDERTDIRDLANKYVRSARTGELVPLSALVAYETRGDSAERRRLNRQAAITIAASIPPDFAAGDALEALEGYARAAIGDKAISIDYTGAARQLKQASGAIGFAFGFALLIVFLVLAAQFESFVHPLIIMTTVPLALAGGLFGLYTIGSSLNIYSQIGLIILIALAAKNGILLVEFANQLRDDGRTVRDTALEAAELRLRPILMTNIATVIGSVPLILGHGAGAESRLTIGIVIFFGLIMATMLTLFVVPVLYDLLARYTRAASHTAREIDELEKAAVSAE
jgi:multidrug efflux pump